MSESIPTVGLNFAVSAAYLGAPLYLGIIVGPGVDNVYADGDTMAAHAGWAELTGYSEGARQLWVPGAVVGGRADNAASPGYFTLTADATIAGFLLSTSPTKGGSAGDLVARANFALDLAGLDTRIVRVRATVRIA